MHKRELFVSEHISVRKRCGLVNMLLLRYLFITTFIVAIPFVSSGRSSRGWSARCRASCTLWTS